MPHVVFYHASMCTSTMQMVQGVIGLLHTLKRTSVYRGRVIVQITNKKVPTYECRLHSAVEIQLAIL